MIIESLMNLVLNLITFLTSGVNIPSLSEEIYKLFDSILSFITQGLGVLSVYCDLPYLLLLFSVVVSVDLGLRLYYIALWILKKIPLLGIE